jgi:hypothetical protein
VATFAGIVILSAVGISAVRGDFSPAPAAPTVRPTLGVAPPALPLQSLTPDPVVNEPADSDPAVKALTVGDSPPGGSGEDGTAGPAPSYEDQAAARDRAAGHSARSR